jgi:hypothetical protein
MTDAAKRVRKALMMRYRQGSGVIPISLREQPIRTQYRGLQRKPEDSPFALSPEVMGVQPQGAVDPVAALMSQVNAMAPADPFSAPMGAQGAPQGAPQDPMAALAGLAGGQAPMMAPEGAPPGAAQAQARTPAQAGPGIDQRQVLASLFG